MLTLIATLSLLAQSQPPSPWRIDVQAARDAALPAKRPCVLLLFSDSF